MVNRGPALVVGITFLLLLAMAFWAARVSWSCKTKHRAWDDFMTAVAGTILVIQTVFGGVAVHYGFGKHRADTLSTLSLAMMYAYLYWVCFMVLGILTKLTFCCFYLRIFSKLPRIRSMAKLVALVTVMGGIAFTLGTIWQCVPIQALWNDNLKSAYCVNRTALFYFHAAYSALVDLMIYSLSIFWLHALRTNRTNKIGLITVFTLGVFVISASTARVAFLRDSTHSSQDPTWDGMPALIWAGVESSFAMILCCLPALGPLAVKVWCKVTRKPNPPLHPGGARVPSAHDWYDFSGHNHGRNPGIGVFTNVHASPTASPMQSSYDLSAPPKAHNKWVDKLKSSFGTHSNSSDSDGAHEIPRPGKAYHTPQIELGNMYRPTSSTTTDVIDLRREGPLWQHTSWMSKSQKGVGLRSLQSGAEAGDGRPRWSYGGTSDLADFLRAGPQIEVAGGPEIEHYVGKGKGRARDLDG